MCVQFSKVRQSEFVVVGFAFNVHFLTTIWFRITFPISMSIMQGLMCMVSEIMSSHH